MNTQKTGVIFNTSETEEVNNCYTEVVVLYFLSS